MSIKVNEIVRGGKRLALLLGVFAMNVCPAETIEGTPDAYLEYVEANGTQYINTGVLPSIGLKARIDLKWTRTTTSSGGFYDWSFLDVRGSGDDRFYLLHLNQYNNQYPAVTYGYGTFHKTTMQASSDRHEILSDFSDVSAIQIYQNGVPCINETDQASLANTSFTMPNLPLYLFAGNYNGTASWYSSASLYELKMFMKNAETGKFDLIRHYLPCKKNGRAALYEKVEGKIYFSNSGHDLLAGPELPRPVEMVEWVQSDGKDPQYHWLDTWVYAKSGLRSEVDFIHKDDNQISGNTAIDRCVLGARKTNSGSEVDSRFYMAYFYQGAFCYGYKSLYYKGGSNVNIVSAVNGNRYFVESDLSVGNQSVKVNGTEIHKDGVAHDDTYFATGNTLTLFAMHEATTFHKVYSSVRLFSAKIWDGDELLRDFAPCVDSNGKAGLYDSVSERVFHLGVSQGGSREFDLTNNVGAVTNWLAETAGTLPDSKIGYIESNGTNDYFNLDVIGKDGVEMEAVMEWVTVPTDGAFVGARTDTQTNANEKAGVRCFPYHHWKDGGSGHRIGYDAKLPGNGAIATAGAKYRIKTHLDAGDQWYTVEEYQNGTWSAPVKTSMTHTKTVDTGLPLYLFAVNYDGVPRYPGQSRVYKLKFWEKQQNGEYALTRDFVPCKKDGKAMLYDKVSGRFFRNRGRYLAIGGGNERPFETGMFLLLK